MSEEIKTANKPYRDLSGYLKDRFGTKVYKLALSAGKTCPNRDGTCGTGGCIFCSEGGSGDFAAPVDMSIEEQIEYAKEKLADKLAGNRETAQYIAYFQSYTNTYGPVDYYERLFTEAINKEEICMLSIATRPDCLEPEVMELLSRLNRIKPVMVEIGLQTSDEVTAKYINRGYENRVFEEAVRKLKESGIETVVHMIIGLPGETRNTILDTAKYIAASGADGIKLQLLHVLKGTSLGTMYMNDPETARSLFVRQPEDYISLVADILEILPPDMVIHRLTGDAPHELLLFPKWSANKRIALNGIIKEMETRGTVQGSRYKKKVYLLGNDYYEQESAGLIL